MKTISQKDGFLFILQKAVDLSYFSVKYEAALLVEDILDINDDNEEFLDLIFTDKDTIALLQEFCMTTLLFDMKFPELIKISITLFDTLFKLEDRNKHRPEISETEGFYLAKAIEENLGEKLEDFMTINSDLCVEIQEFIVKHQLIATEDWTEIAQKTNEAIFNSKFTF